MSARIHSLDDFLLLLKGVKPGKDGQFTALCPGHDDHEPSLSVTESDDKILVKCFAGCELVNILKPLGLEPRSLFLDDHDCPKSKKQKTLVATFSYEYERGKEAYQIRRFDLGNGGKTFEAWHKKDGRYVSGMGEYKDKPILQHLPEIPGWIAAAKRIYIPEGELKADRIISKGGAATTSPFGAGRNKWRSEYSKALAGAEVIVLPDNDNPGRDFAQDKAASLYGIARSVKVLELPGLPEKGDIIDWFNAGGTFEQLEQLADNCPEYKPSDNGVKLRCMADINAEAMSWLWPPYIPKGKVTLMEGDPGIGKSWVSLAIATAITLGKDLLGQEPSEPANVLIASAEDGLGDTIRPRLDTMGADVSRVFAIDGALTLDEGGFGLLEGYIERVRPALLIIDPLVAYLGADVDIHRANETRAVMAQMARLAEKFDVAILAVRHLTKGGMSKPIYRGLGSIDFTAACRSVLLAGCDSENPHNRALVHIKSNLSPAGPSIGYELRKGRFYWTGESTLTAAQILAAESSTGISELDEAMAFLKDMLAGGEVPAKSIYQAAQDTGIAKRTLERAKAKLQAKSRKIGDTWFWCLPEPTSPTSPYKEFGKLENIQAKKEVTTEGLGDVDYESVLGMPVEKALEIWRSEGAPVIHPGPGENCFDLAKLLSNPNAKPEHLEPVKAWLGKVLEQRGEA